MSSRLLGLIFLLIVMAALADAVVAMVKPWLPLLLLAGIGGSLGWLATQRRNRW